MDIPENKAERTTSDAINVLLNVGPRSSGQVNDLDALKFNSYNHTR